MIGQKDNTTIKATVYLQGCLQSNGCSASRLHRRYPNCCTRLKLIDLVIQNIYYVFPKMTHRSFPRGLNSKPYIIFFKSSTSTRFLYFGNFSFFFSRSGTQTLKKTCWSFPLFDCIQKLQNIFIPRNNIIFRIVKFPNSL